jgi:GntR family transcriptional repressor for pyruvate dehydrogenase complex
MTAIKRKKLADSVIEEIIRRIESGELKEGDKLPNQNEFAAQLGVSRPSLREALHTLTLIGAIEQRPGFGTVIRAENTARMAEHLSPPLVSDTAATMELMEARRYIELSVVDLAVERATDEDLTELKSSIRAMKDALEQDRPDDYTQADLAFHYQIASAAHNRFLIHLFVTIRGLMEQFMREAFTVRPRLLDKSMKFHTLIYEGIRDRNREKALDQMKQHLESIETALADYYQQKTASSTISGEDDNGGN